MSIPTRVLGRTGLMVTEIAYGAMEIRGLPKGRDISEADVERLLNTILDSGINLIDTSIDYGLSEERIGRHVGHRREEFILTSKCGCPLVDDGNTTRGSRPHDYSRENITAGLLQSLRRLRTDYVDVLQVHLSPSVSVLQADEVIETLHNLQADGTVRFIGMSGVHPHLPHHINMGAFDVFQIPYSVVEPEHADAIHDASNAGAGVLVRGGAAKGVPSQESRPIERSPGLWSVWERANLGAVLEGMSAMEFTIRYTLTHPGMTTNIVGTLNVEHLAQNVAATLKGPLPAETLAEVDRRVAEVLDSAPS